MANPVRLAVLKQLRKGAEFCVNDLVEQVGTEQTNLSHHLAQLRACGLVATRQDGKKVCYSIAHPRLETILDLGEGFAKHVACTDGALCVEAGCC